MKLAIISGGSRGLGAALVDLYRGEGYTIVELSRSAKLAESIRLDLSNPKDVTEKIPSIFADLAGQPLESVLFFNNAGVLPPIGMISSKETADILANINVNYTSAILLMREFVLAFQAAACPKMIVNISSGAALRGMYGWSLYCGAKAGIENFVRSVAVEQADQSHPIKAVNIGPGIIDTDMQATIRSATAEDFPSVERFKEFKSGGNLKSPETVAQGIANIINSHPDTGSRHNVSDYL
ncbi:MAG: SDR family NAD(P)-dependent oxidoreductase [Chloroflexota bacterium]